MSYKFMETILEDWQVKSFKFKGQRDQKVKNESEGRQREQLMIKENQVYTLYLQGLTSSQSKELYKKAREYSLNDTYFVFYGISSDPSDLYYNETVNMNYKGDSEFGFATRIENDKITDSLKGILYDMTFEVVEER